MMKQSSAPFNALANSQGFLSADFLFSMVIASGLCAMFFALTLTLTMAEVGQYLAFSITRAHMAGHKDQSSQEEMAQAKFKSFQSNKVLNPLLTNGWFEIKNLVVRGAGPSGKDFTDRYPRGPANQADMPQTGVRLEFEAKILKGRIPMLGGTNGSIEHKAFITGLMIREPSADECLRQIRQQRYSAILALDPRYATVAGKSAQKYVPMEDNGC